MEDLFSPATMSSASGITFGSSRTQGYLAPGADCDDPSLLAADHAANLGVGCDFDSGQQQTDASLHENVKRMTTSSKAAQFWTTIALKSCLYVKENFGSISSTRRAQIVFKKLEFGLRDRSTYPLPSDVSQAALLSHSFFKGPDAESKFLLYCAEPFEKPLENWMIAKGDNVFSNTFSRIRTLISTEVLPKFLKIVETITGKHGNKSGCAAFGAVFLFFFTNFSQVQRTCFGYACTGEQKAASGAVPRTCRKTGKKCQWGTHIL